ncbi:MAG TPA: winged helix-turn-helix transcriptional regulator [Burkholderiaceae bacterium]|nr:winged helix-turn-helix transcriptional regulator [Burkholderiaceae bacterium]
MATNKRSYLDGCAAAHALDLVGERWALLVVRELLLGPKRFSDLRAGLGAISPNVLSQRLAELEASGILLRHKLPPPANVQVYALTDWGRELEPIILQLVRWGVRSPAFTRGAALGVDALVLSFKAMFNPNRAPARDLTVELWFDDQCFGVSVADGHIDVTRGAAAHPAATIKATPRALLHLAYGKQDLDVALQAGRVAFSGERGAVERFLDCFDVPASIGQEVLARDDSTMPPTINAKATA